MSDELTNDAKDGLRKIIHDKIDGISDRFIDDFFIILETMQDFQRVKKGIFEQVSSISSHFMGHNAKHDTFISFDILDRNTFANSRSRSDYKIRCECHKIDQCRGFP